MLLAQVIGFFVFVFCSGDGKSRVSGFLTPTSYLFFFMWKIKLLWIVFQQDHHTLLFSTLEAKVVSGSSAPAGPFIILLYSFLRCRHEENGPQAGGRWLKTPGWRWPPSHRQAASGQAATTPLWEACWRRRWEARRRRILCGEVSLVSCDISYGVSELCMMAKPYSLAGWSRASRRCLQW